MIIYLDNDFNPVDKDIATLARVIPDNGDAPYFVALNQSEKDTEETD